MVKWLALMLSLIALFTAADERKTRAEFDLMEARLRAMEAKTCVLMAVNTPTGVTSICAPTSPN